MRAVRLRGSAPAPPPGCGATAAAAAGAAPATCAPRLAAAAAAAAAATAAPHRGLATRVRPKYFPSPLGVVKAVHGDTATVAGGLSAATPLCLVTFQGGGTGLVTDMRADGDVAVELLTGPPPAPACGAAW
jgi:hypothetical protein